MHFFTFILLYGIINILNVSYATECLAFTDSGNICQTPTESNLGIALGKSQYSGTDSPIIFSWCINNICSTQWYKLDHCNYDDFKGSCSYEYFIIPEFEDAMSDAVNNEENDFRFEFVNCGDDGIQIDEISIGTKCNQYGKIKFFPRDGDEDKHCNFADYGESSFAIDGNGECRAVSISWSGYPAQEATLYSTLTHPVDLSEICTQAKITKCASEDNDCEARAVRPIEGIADLAFSGDGKYDCDSNGNCEYFFSFGFQTGICDSTNMIKSGGAFGKWISKTFKIASLKWCAQGISQYGDYVTRVFYEGGEADYTDYVVVSVIKKGEAVRYSNILVAQPDNGKSPCHAGGMVLTQVNGEYWFLVACSSWIMVFSEKSIQYSTGYSVNGKKFYYKVSKENVKSIYKGDTDIKLSWISRNQGTNNEFWTGYCDSQEKTILSCDGCDWDVRLRLVTLDVEDTWEITNVVEYTFDPSAVIDLTFIQGATRIGNFMYLSKTDLVPALNNWILKCPIDGTDVGACLPVCKLRIGFGLNYIQGAETDDEGNLYVGAEFGPIGRRAPWFILTDLDYDDKRHRECLPDFWSNADIEPFNLPQQRPMTPNAIHTQWRYEDIGLILLFGVAMFTLGISFMMCCKNKSKHKYYNSVKTVSHDEESDVL